MNAPSPSRAPAASALLQARDARETGDLRWAQPPQTWRGRERARPWPPERLDGFTRCPVAVPLFRHVEPRQPGVIRRLHRGHWGCGKTPMAPVSSAAVRSR